MRKNRRIAKLQAESTTRVLDWWHLSVNRNASPCKRWQNQRKVCPSHSGLWLSATVAGGSAFMRGWEGELLCLRQPMSKSCMTDYSPPRPPSIICSGLSVPVVCGRVFHQSISKESERYRDQNLQTQFWSRSCNKDWVTHLCAQSAQKI